MRISFTESDYLSHRSLETEQPVHVSSGNSKIVSSGSGNTELHEDIEASDGVDVSDGSPLVFEPSEEVRHAADDIRNNL